MTSSGCHVDLGSSCASLLLGFWILPPSMVTASYFSTLEIGHSCHVCCHRFRTSPVQNSAIHPRSVGLQSDQSRIAPAHLGCDDLQMKEFDTISCPGLTGGVSWNTPLPDVTSCIMLYPVVCVINERRDKTLPALFPACLYGLLIMPFKLTFDFGRVSPQADPTFYKPSKPAGEKPDKPVHTVVVRLAATSSRMSTQET